MNIDTRFIAIGVLAILALIHIGDGAHKQVLSQESVEAVDATDSPLRARISALQAERIETLRRVAEILEKQRQEGEVDLRRVFTARCDLMEAQLELADQQEERLALRTELRDLAKSHEEFIHARLRQGSVTQLDYLEAGAERLQREVDLLREQR